MDFEPVDYDPFNPLQGAVTPKTLASRIAPNEFDLGTHNSPGKLWGATGEAIGNQLLAPVHGLIGGLEATKGALAGHFDPRNDQDLARAIGGASLLAPGPLLGKGGGLRAGFGGSIPTEMKELSVKELMDKAWLVDGEHGKMETSIPDMAAVLKAIHPEDKMGALSAIDTLDMGIKDKNELANYLVKFWNTHPDAHVLHGEPLHMLEKLPEGDMYQTWGPMIAQEMLKTGETDPIKAVQNVMYSQGSPQFTDDWLVGLTAAAAKMANKGYEQVPFGLPGNATPEMVDIWNHMKVYNKNPSNALDQFGSWASAEGPFDWAPHLKATSEIEKLVKNGEIPFHVLPEAMHAEKFSSPYTPTANPVSNLNDAIKPLDWLDHSTGVPPIKNYPPLIQERFAQAEAQGYNTTAPLYKGMSQDLRDNTTKSQSVNALWDPSTKPNERAVFAAHDPRVAEHYAGQYQGEGHILPMFARSENAFEVNWPEINNGSKGYSSYTMQKAIDHATQRGADMLVIKNISDLGGPQTQYAIIKPEILRSWFAKFDPARKGENDLLAAGGTGGLRLVPVENDPFGGKDETQGQ